MGRVRNLIRKELIQLGRDWVLTAFIIALPVLQLVLLARATGSSITDLKVVVVDRDRSAASRAAVASLRNRDELAVERAADTVAEAEGLLDAGEVLLAVVIPEDFSETLENGQSSPRTQLVADGSNELVADIALRAAQAAFAEFVNDWAEGAPDGSMALIDLRSTVRYNPSLDVKLFAVPSQLGFIVYQVTLAVASVGFARERELGTLEQLIVMPLTRVELILGKAAPALLVGLLNFLTMLAVTVWGFGVPMRGSMVLLLGFTFLFVAAEIGYGILISGIAETQQQAILLVFVLAMVDMAFSGYLVPVQNLPAALQWVAQFVPLRHYLAVIRNVMLRGAGPAVLWQHAAAVLATGAVVTGIAARNLSRRLD
jgi:ABC-2 type transport system permease protein